MFEVEVAVSRPDGSAVTVGTAEFATAGDAAGRTRFVVADAQVRRGRDAMLRGQADRWASQLARDILVTVPQPPLDVRRTVAQLQRLLLLVAVQTATAA